MSNNAHELSNRLVNALDNNYNVVDMHTVNEIISILEKFNITKELLETTRLGKHVNELRRKTSDPTLARRAKVLVKRWRDLVIPTVASPGHSGNLSNRSSAERSTVRRLGGTPLTSPALTRQVVSPAVHSPRPPSRPAWGGYESDSQDVILVDDDPPPAPPPPPPPPPPAPPAALHNAHKPLTPPVKRPPSPQPLHDDKKAKRDKKPKRKRGHSRAGSGTESAAGEVGAVGAVGEVGGAGDAHTWRDRNGSSQLHRKRNGCRKSPLDPYTALVNRMPKAGDKKVKTTKELLEQIQMRGACAPSPSPCPPAPSSPHSPDVMFIEPDTYPTKVESPLRNGTSPAPPPSPPPAPLPPLEDEREYHECTCGDAPQETCRAARRTEVTPLHVAALHHAYLPGINGTRAPLHPHRFAVRDPVDPDRPGLFTAVVPLYKYSDYANDRCAKNMFRVPICRRLPWTEFAPDPPAPPPPPSPPPPRPYPVDETPAEDAPLEIKKELDDDDEDDAATTIEAETVGVPVLEPSERLKAPILSPDEDAPRGTDETPVKMEVEDAFETKHQDHRTVERTKEETNGQMLFDLVRRAADGIPYDYDQMFTAPVVTLPDDEYRATETLEEALLKAEEDTTRDELGRPNRPENFSEWHECARLGELIALPYVVID